jgi:dihydrofolate reductase
VSVVACHGSSVLGSWPSRTDDGSFADKMNGMPQYVVSTTLEDPTWTNAAVIKGDVAEEVAKLNEQPGGDIGIARSAQLVQSFVDTT